MDYDCAERHQLIERLRSTCRNKKQKHAQKAEIIVIVAFCAYSDENMAVNIILVFLLQIGTIHHYMQTYTRH